MPSPLPYRNHFHRDWISSSTIRRMSFGAEGIYHALLDIQWEDGFIPEDPEEIKAVLMKAKPQEWASFEPYLEKCFPVTESGRRENPRCAEERAKAIEKVEQNRANAQKPRGGRKAKAKPPKSERLTTAKPPQSGRTAIPDTDTESVTDVTPPSSPPGDEKASAEGSTLDGMPVVALLEDEGPSLDDWWQRFLEAYPKRSGDKRAGEARKKFDRQVKHDKADPAEVVAGAERYRDWCDAVGNTGTPMVKQMSTFMNQLGWQEEWNIPESKRPPQKPEPQGVVNHLTGFRGTE